VDRTARQAVASTRVLAGLDVDRIPPITLANTNASSHSPEGTRVAVRVVAQLAHIGRPSAACSTWPSTCCQAAVRAVVPGAALTRNP
jgi:hypothetical protein